MRRKHLTLWFQRTLESLSMLLMMFFGSLERFDLSVSSVILIAITMLMLIAITYVLDRYGRYGNA